MEQSIKAIFFGGTPMNRLREVRVTKRITQFQLRIQTGIHQSKISLIENDLILPGEDEKRKLARALGMRPEEIFPPGSRLAMEGQHAGV